MTSQRRSFVVLSAVILGAFGRAAAAETGVTTEYDVRYGALTVLAVRAIDRRPIIGG